MPRPVSKPTRSNSTDVSAVDAARDLAHVQEPGAAADAELDRGHPAHAARHGQVGGVQEPEGVLLAQDEVEEDLAPEAAARPRRRATAG